jgi:hypothetical protein
LARWYIRFPRLRMRRRSLLGTVIAVTVRVYVCTFILMMNMIVVPIAGTVALVRSARASP